MSATPSRIAAIHISWNGLTGSRRNTAAVRMVMGLMPFKKAAEAEAPTDAMDRC